MRQEQEVCLAPSRLEAACKIMEWGRKDVVSRKTIFGLWSLGHVGFEVTLSNLE